MSTEAGAIHVAGSDDTAQAARDVLSRNGININSPMNGAFLPGCGNGRALGAVHCGGHSGDYLREVNLRLISAEAHGGKLGVLNALSEIKIELLSGTMQINGRGVW